MWSHDVALYLDFNNRASCDASWLKIDVLLCIDVYYIDSICASNFNRYIAAVY